MPQEPRAGGTVVPHPTAASRRPPHRERPGLAPTAERERLVTLLSGLVEPLGRALATGSEVVLHDIARLPESIVAAYGDVTGRRVGDPATDVLLEIVAQDGPDHLVGYETTLPDGRTMRSSTVLVRDRFGVPVAALCVNTDVGAWEALRAVAGDMIGDPRDRPVSAVPLDGPLAAVPEPDPPRRTPGPRAGGPTDSGPETFVRSVDELAEHLISRAVADVGVPVGLMKKKHKLTVVGSLRGRGLFLLKDAVEMVAAALEVSRFTVYNYLNETEHGPDRPR